jgi:hypothetical protein
MEAMMRWLMRVLCVLAIMAAMYVRSMLHIPHDVVVGVVAVLFILAGYIGWGIYEFSPKDPAQGRAQKR